MYFSDKCICARLQVGLSLHLGPTRDFDKNNLDILSMDFSEICSRQANGGKMDYVQEGIGLIRQHTYFVNQCYNSKVVE